MDQDTETSRHKRPLLTRASWRAASHLVRHHPGAALGAIGAGVKFAARELLHDGTATVRRIGESLRKPKTPPVEGNELAKSFDEHELRALAKLGRERNKQADSD